MNFMNFLNFSSDFSLRRTKIVSQSAKTVRTFPAVANLPIDHCLLPQFRRFEYSKTFGFLNNRRSGSSPHKTSTEGLNLPTTSAQVLASPKSTNHSSQVFSNAVIS